MNHLKSHDDSNNLLIVDIHDQAFNDYPHINRDDALTILHGIDSSGRVITGLDVTYRAWQAVGKGYLIKPLRWPLVRVITDKLYMFFAQHRHSISSWLTGPSTCEHDCSRSKK
ncbi:thiol-disulfide oxidoreductase DCC family protein [Thalassotalea ponticola]